MPRGNSRGAWNDSKSSSRRPTSRMYSLSLFRPWRMEALLTELTESPTVLSAACEFNSYGRVGSAPSSYRIGPFAAQLIASR